MVAADGLGAGEVGYVISGVKDVRQAVEVARRNAAAENVEQKVYRVDGSDAKRAAVAKLVRDNALSQVIVFTNTRSGAENRSWRGRPVSTSAPG